mgnify:CR=1 FL=1
MWTPQKRAQYCSLNINSAACSRLSVKAYLVTAIQKSSKESKSAHFHALRDFRVSQKVTPYSEPSFELKKLDTESTRSRSKQTGRSMSGHDLSCGSVLALLIYCGEFCVCLLFLGLIEPSLVQKPAITPWQHSILGEH